MTGFQTRAAFLRNVMSTQSITHHPNTLILLKECEQLYQHIKSKDCSSSLHDEELLFIDAMRDLASSNRKQKDDNDGDNDDLSFDGISKLLSTGSSFKRTMSSASTSSNDTNSIDTNNTNNKRKSDNNNEDSHVITKVHKSVKCT
jgi:hypothetical protein